MSSKFWHHLLFLMAKNPAELSDLPGRLHCKVCSPNVGAKGSDTGQWHNSAPNLEDCSHCSRGILQDRSLHTLRMKQRFSLKAELISLNAVPPQHGDCTVLLNVPVVDLVHARSARQRFVHISFKSLSISCETCYSSAHLIIKGQCPDLVSHHQRIWICPIILS